MHNSFLDPTIHESHFLCEMHTSLDILGNCVFYVLKQNGLVSSCAYKQSLIRQGSGGIMHKCNPRDANATTNEILGWTPEMVEYVNILHWNIVGGALDTPPVPYVSSGFVTSTMPLCKKYVNKNLNLN